ncbi:MAG: hypothetical protein V6Z89_09105 [Desulfobacter sp.]
MDIPWQEKTRFREVCSFFHILDMNRRNDLAPVRSLAREIGALYVRTAPELERLCAATCPECRENCCKRATIWYDFRDMLYLCLGPGSPPERQISKTQGVQGYGCSHLAAHGCRLPRHCRPFVCTWYVCAAQKPLVTGSNLGGTVNKIKVLRKKMEDEFCRITGA